MIDEKRFNKLWERAETEGYASKLASEYPTWHRRQRRAASMVAGVALVLAVAVPLGLRQDTVASYEKVYCNRMDKPTQEWVDLAQELLIS